MNEARIFGIALAAVVCLSACAKPPAEPAAAQSTADASSSIQGESMSSASSAVSAVQSQPTWDAASSSTSSVGASSTGTSSVGASSTGTSSVDGVPTGTELAQSAEDKANQVKSYIVDGGSRRELENPPVTVPLTLGKQPFSMKKTPLSNVSFEGQTPKMESSTGGLQVFDIDFLEPTKTQQNRMKLQVVIPKQEQVLLEVPCLDRTVNDPVAVMTKGGTLVMPSSEYGILTYYGDEYEQTYTHIDSVVSMPEDPMVPHRLIGFLYDEELGRFLVLHTQEVDKTQEKDAVQAAGNMILTVYDSRWQALAVYDTGLLPDTETDETVVRRYTFTLEESGIVFVGGKNANDKLAILYS